MLSIEVMDRFYGLFGCISTLVVVAGTNNNMTWLFLQQEVCSGTRVHGSGLSRAYETNETKGSSVNFNKTYTNVQESLSPVTILIVC